MHFGGGRRQLQVYLVTGETQPSLLPLYYDYKFSVTYKRLSLLWHRILSDYRCSVSASSDL